MKPGEIKPLKRRFNLSEKKMEQLNRILQESNKFGELQRELSKILRHEHILEELYTEYGDRRVCEILALIRSKKDSIQNDSEYCIHKEIRRAAGLDNLPNICLVCGYDHCAGNMNNCGKLISWKNNGEIY